MGVLDARRKRAQNELGKCAPPKHKSEENVFVTSRIELRVVCV